jgi:hypothetical protein
MSNFEEIQSQATEQALREQNQLLRKQLENMNAQMLAFMAQIQGNITAQSSQNSQEVQTQNQEQAIQPPAQATAQINIPQPGTAYPPQVLMPQVFVSSPPTTSPESLQKYLIHGFLISQKNQVATPNPDSRLAGGSSTDGDSTGEFLEA